MSDVKFIRVRGRIIPIKKKNEPKSDVNWKAPAGAITGAAIAGATMTAVAFRKTAQAAFRIGSRMTPRIEGKLLNAARAGLTRRWYKGTIAGAVIGATAASLYSSFKKKK